MKKIFFSLLSVLMIAAMASCSSSKEQDNSLQKVRLATVENITKEKHASYPGRTQASESSDVAFRVSGTIASIPVKVGDKVNAGQVVAMMDDRDYKVQLKATEAEYQSTKAECERIIALYKDNGTSENNYDKARYGLEQITAKYEHAKDQVTDCKLRAPYSGYVQSVLHDSHETVSAGMPIISLFASNGVEIKIFLPVSEYQNQDKFDKFTASFDVMEGQTFDLKVKSIAKKANVNQLYEMTLLLEGDHSQITPGMTAMVDISYKPEENMPVAVPSNAVLAENGNSFVFIFGNDGILKKTPVTINEIHSDGRAVISGSVKAGDKVVASGVHHVSDGEQVEANPEASSTNVGGLL